MYSYFLVIKNKQIQESKEIEVTGLGTFSIGREGDIKINGQDFTISRKHCLIALPKKWPKNDACWLFDISKNGCLVNGEPIDRKGQERAVRLLNADIIQIGSVEIKFSIVNTDFVDLAGTLS